MVTAILKLFPSCPPKEEARAIAEHTALRGSGRVGRTAAGQELAEGALTAAVVAHIRHCHTRYDEFLMDGVDRDNARHRVREAIDEMLDSWRGL
jgi:hypothetical protein